MKLTKLLEGVNVIDIQCSTDIDISNVCCDSRLASEGSAFVAARRVNTDGHDYIDAARENGASVIICERPAEGGAYVLVGDTRAALAQMSANFYGNPAKKMTMIGITGTKGKSTTAFNIKHILTQATGAKVGLIGTMWYMAGDEILAESKNSTPEAPLLHKTLRDMLDKGCTHVVMEVSSHALDTGRVFGIDFSSAVFTNLSQDHLDYHITMDNYLSAKAKLFSMTSSCAVNIDDSASGYILEKSDCRKLAFGIDKDDADVRAVNIDLYSPGGVQFDAAYNSARHTIKLYSAGRFMVYNAIAAISCALSVGVDFESACEAMNTASAVPGRVQNVDCGQDFRVIVDYAHSPESVKQICQTAREFTKQRLIVLLGCGGNRDRTKRPIMGSMAAHYADYVIVTTDNPRFEVPEDIIAEIEPGVSSSGKEYSLIVDRRAAISHAICEAKTGDTVLILGKGSETYQEVCGVRSYFSDVDEAEKALKERNL